MKKDHCDPDRRAWAVIDPASAKGRAWAAVLGTDAVELASVRLIRTDATEPPGFRVAADRLTPAQQLRLARHVAGSGGVTWQLAFVTLLHWTILIPAREVYVCQDPEVGRGFWASLFPHDAGLEEEEGGPRDA